MNMPITVSSTLSEEKLNDMMLRLHMRAGATITIRHDLAEDELRRALLHLHHAFERADISLMEYINRGMVGFERMTDATVTATEAVLTLSKAFGDLKDQSDFICLKQTAWERRNPNAPWWRKFERRRRA